MRGEIQEERVLDERIRKSVLFQVKRRSSLGASPARQLQDTHSTMSASVKTCWRSTFFPINGFDIPSHIKFTNEKNERPNGSQQRNQHNNTNTFKQRTTSILEAKSIFNASDAQTPHRPPLPTTRSGNQKPHLLPHPSFPPISTPNCTMLGTKHPCAI